METVKRGYEPKDKIEFGSKAAVKLNAAAQEPMFLMDRGYDTKSASGRCCWIRRRAALSGYGWSCTPAWMASSPA